MSRSRVVPLRLPVAGRGPGTQRESLCEGPRPVAGRAPGGGDPGVRGAREWSVEWSAPTGIPRHTAQRPVPQEPGRPSCGAAPPSGSAAARVQGRDVRGRRYQGERRACVEAPSAAAGASRSHPRPRGVQPVPAAHAESSAGMSRPSFLRRILTARPARSRGARHFGERPVRQALHRPQGDRRRPGGRGQRPCGRPVRQG